MDKVREADRPQCNWEDEQERSSEWWGLCPQCSPFPHRLCGRPRAGNSRPGPGDPRRPGDSHPAHWHHHVAKMATPGRGEVSAESQTPQAWGTPWQQGEVGEVLGSMCRILPNPPPQEGPREPGGGGGRTCRAESVGRARGSREQCRGAVKEPQPPTPPSLSSLSFPHTAWPQNSSPV